MTRPLPARSLIKVPRQSRSTLMVHSILDAAERILEDEGEGALNTNRIAEVAGVSPGSLYQYFSSREKILEGLLERGTLELRARIEREVVSRELAPEAAARSALALTIEALGRHAAVVNEVLQCAPLLGESGLVPALEAGLRAESPTVARLWPRDELGTAALDGVLFAMLRWAADRPAQVSPAALVDSILRLCRGLAARAAPPPPPLGRAA